MKIHYFYVLIIFIGWNNAPIVEAKDPLQKLNRKIYFLNDSLDRVIARPIVRAYLRIIPKFARSGISNFYANIGYLDTIINTFFQGKIKTGIADIERFLVNSTFGVAGLVDAASSLEMKRHEEDFGQTLGIWGIREGCFLMLPLLGPSTLRDTPGLIISAVTNGFVFALVIPNYAIQQSTLGFLDVRANFFESTELIDELSVDAYIFVREAYRQHRNFLIFDGDPPSSLIFDDPYLDLESKP